MPLDEDAFGIPIIGKRGRGWSGKTMEGAEGIIEVVLELLVFCGMALALLFDSFATQHVFGSLESTTTIASMKLS